jgi:hypothetical protein
MIRKGLLHNEIGEYYVSSIKGTPFVCQGKSKDDCTKQTFEMIAGFMDAFPDYKKMFRKYRILK